MAVGTSLGEKAGISACHTVIGHANMEDNALFIGMDNLKCVVKCCVLQLVGHLSFGAMEINSFRNIKDWAKTFDSL